MMLLKYKETNEVIHQKMDPEADGKHFISHLMRYTLLYF